MKKQKRIYSDISKIQTNIPQHSKSQYYTVPQITQEETLKINICMVHTHYRNLENPGTYANELNRILRANNLLNINIPESQTPAKFSNLNHKKNNFRHRDIATK